MSTLPRKSAAAVTRPPRRPAGHRLRVGMSITCPGTPASVSAARHWVRRVLAGWPRADEAELVAAELMTNAIRHPLSGQAGGAVTLTRRQQPGRTMIEVGDLGDVRAGQPGRQRSASPRPPARRPDVVGHGRGLEIVSALADQHGRTSTGGPARNSWALLNW